MRSYALLCKMCIMRSYTKVCTDQAFCPIALADGHFEKLSNCKCVEANANFYQFFRTKVIIGMHEKDLSLTWYPKWRGVFSYKEYSILNFKLLWIPDCGKLCNINKHEMKWKTTFDNFLYGTKKDPILFKRLVIFE